MEELKERVQSTIRAENQAVAVRAEAVAELRRRKGTELVETVLETTRRGTQTARVSAINELKALLVTAPIDLRDQLPESHHRRSGNQMPHAPTRAKAQERTHSH